MKTEQYLQLSQFYQQYAAVVDQANWEAWVAMFTEKLYLQGTDPEKF
ncbi:nuclear transport factor 2 family protein [Vibrio sp. PP-XX7]